MTILSLTAIARVAERHVRTRGPQTSEDLLALLATVAADPDRAQAGLRLAVIGGRLELDADGTLRAAGIRETAA